MSSPTKLDSKGFDDPLDIKLRCWSSIAITGFSVFPVVVLLLHILHPEFAPTQRFISEYALGRYGWLLSVAIVGNLIGSLALFYLLYCAYPPPWRSWTVLISLGAATLSILTNFFPTDPHGKAITLSGFLHNMGTFCGSIAGLVCMVVLSRHLHRLGLLQGWYRSLRIMSIAASVIFLVMLLCAEHLSGYIGLLQRGYAAMILFWFILTAYGIRSGAIRPGKAVPPPDR